MSSQTGRLLVISNRLPATIRVAQGKYRVTTSAGGVVTALQPILRERRGLWVGWPGECLGNLDPASRLALLQDLNQRGLYPVELTTPQVKLFYEGYANQTLWPLFHHFPSRLVFDPAGWEAYVDANNRFLEAILSVVRKEDLIWVHDYQLMLLPQMIREAQPEARIGFFLHIPFPSSAVFRVLPHREELLQGLLGADFVAFQTHTYLQHFRSSLLRILGIESRMDQVQLKGRVVRLEALPIGIAAGPLTALSSDTLTARHMESLRERFRDCRLLLAVDRLDYTKGIPERLRAFRRLLSMNPEFRGKLVLVQVAVPSRERVPSYQQLRREVNELVGSINGDYGTTEWTPVVYMRRSVSRHELVALYSCADVAWVTPLRDGMNLVAKEYVACQAENLGTLVLSEFAGAAAEMGEALLVNPYDEERMAACVAAALRMPEDERRQRMSALRQRVLRNDAFAWADRFVQGLTRASEERAEHGTGGADAPSPQQMLAAFRSAAVRWVFLDYDGTLVPYTDHPAQAAPPPDLLEQVNTLAAERNTYVALVSGRRKEDLARWFPPVDGLWIVAEHGAFMRQPASGSWESLNPVASDAWKGRVRRVLEHFVDRTPGSLLEEKEHALVWHYRMSEPEFGDWLANELVATLEQLLAETDLRATRGQKIVEVRPVWASKREAVVRLSRLWPAAGFCLALGDDQTDEEMFAALPEEAMTVRVGEGFSRARFRVPDPRSVRALLATLTSSEL